MIYESLDNSAPIRQGDIFFGLPRVDLSLRNVILVDEFAEREVSWRDVAGGGNPVNVIVPVSPVMAIVATQDCDAERSPDITLCEIRNFRDVEKKSKDTTAPKKFMKLITQHARLNQKWYYLPPDERIGFTDKMAVDFLVTLRVPRVDLEEMKDLRRGRLNKVAEQHFRERIGEFFRRYAYNEWYPLGGEELKAYLDEYPGVSLYSWQDQQSQPSG